jgi:hypothetical protein
MNLIFGCDYFDIVVMLFGINLIIFRHGYDNL